jgi:hypothetical protein
MNRPRPLRDYPPATLDTVSSIITTLLLGCQDMLPTDLYVKLDLFRGDITNAISPGPRLPAIRPRHSSAASARPLSSCPRSAR